MEHIIEFNTNILETNLINILLLFGLLLYANNVSFKASLESRQSEIAQNIENAQNNVNEALSYYSLAEKNIEKTYLYINLWKENYQKAKVNLINSKYENIKNLINEIFQASENLIESFEQKTNLSLQRYAIILTTGKLLKRFFSFSLNEKSKMLSLIISNLGE